MSTSRSLTLSRILLICALLVGLCGLNGSALAATSSTPAPAANSATFGIGPATATRLDPHRGVLNYEVQPGARLTDHVALVNLATKPVTLAVYTADGLNNRDGSIGYQPQATPGDGARTWITVDTKDHRRAVTVPARGLVIVPISLDVPSNASPGDHIAAVVASITSAVDSSGRTHANLEQRVALRTFFRVSGDLTPQLSIEGLHASYHGTLNPFGSGSVTVTYTVRNTGNVLLGGRQRVTVTGLFGSTGSLKALADVPVLLQGSSYPVRVLVPEVWPEIFMHATVSVTPESVAGAANPPLKVARAETSFFAVPWTLLGLILVLLALIVGGWLWRRAHPRVARHRPPSGGSK